ncbi:CHAP domain-containing protein [Solitalea koreensis]|uniref:CHAP domain-containing protein n=1 Tax=Solitalea koreensis TaxID=543615 RepID=A0A521BNA4_9SPHI|nr:CHAP domain-containing protein [Solitalea koreensis]SMO48090.1 CHAP domain-containing protein [Solitalea koreensis]
MKASDLIVAIATQYLGKTEKPNNSGFNDATFEKKMKAVGWREGEAWCSYLVELIWKEAFEARPDLVEAINKAASGSATATFRQFDVANVFEVGQKPKPGAIAIWRYGNGWQGHAGIVKSVVDANTFISIEGNTNDKGGREGYIVAEKRRLVKAPYSEKGLNVVGFIYPETV